MNLDPFHEERDLQAQKFRSTRRTAASIKRSNDFEALPQSQKIKIIENKLTVNNWKVNKPIKTGLSDFISVYAVEPVSGREDWFCHQGIRQFISPEFVAYFHPPFRPRKDLSEKMFALAKERGEIISPPFAEKGSDMVHVFYPVSQTYAYVALKYYIRRKAEYTGRQDYDPAFASKGQPDSETRAAMRRVRLDPNQGAITAYTTNKKPKEVHLSQNFYKTLRGVDANLIALDFNLHQGFHNYCGKNKPVTPNKFLGFLKLLQDSKVAPSVRALTHTENYSFDQLEIIIKLVQKKQIEIYGAYPDFQSLDSPFVLRSE